LGALQIDPGGISYGSQGSSRSGAPRERAHERATIPEGSQMDMRPRCGRRLAHVRGPGVFAALKPPATVCDRVAVGGGESRWERGPRIPLGALHVDPGGISYGSRGLSRSDAPPERANERATIPEGSQTCMRPRCGRRLAHVRCPGVVATLKPPATVCDRVAVGGGESRWERGPRIPLGALQIDPGGIAYGSRGLSRSGAPPECVIKRATIPEGSQMDMRPRCGRRLAHVRRVGAGDCPPEPLTEPD
jgi:hypothetical protein